MKSDYMNIIDFYLLDFLRVYKLNDEEFIKCYEDFDGNMHSRGITVVEQNSKILIIQSRIYTKVSGQTLQEREDNLNVYEWNSDTEQLILRVSINVYIITKIESSYQVVTK